MDRNIFLHVDVPVRVYNVYIYEYMFVLIHTYTSAYRHVGMYASVHACKYIYIDIHTYVYVYMHTCIHLLDVCLYMRSVYTYIHARHVRPSVYAGRHVYISIHTLVCASDGPVGRNSALEAEAFSLKAWGCWCLWLQALADLETEAPSRHSSGCQGRGFVACTKSVISAVEAMYIRNM